MFYMYDLTSKGGMHSVIVGVIAAFENLLTILVARISKSLSLVLTSVEYCHGERHTNRTCLKEALLKATEWGKVRCSLSKVLCLLLHVSWRQVRERPQH